MQAINNNAIRPVLRILAKKGACDVLSEMQYHESMRYNEVLNYLLDAHIIKSRECVRTILNDLTEWELLERTTTDDRPPKACYRLSKKGIDMINYLKKIEKLAKKK